MSAGVAMKVGKTPDPSMALNNMVYVSKRDARKLRVRDQEQYCEVGDCVYIVRVDKTMEQGEMGLNALQRRHGRYALGDSVTAEPYILGQKDRNFYLSQLVVEINFLSAKYVTDAPFELEKLHECFLKEFCDHFFTVKQSVVVIYGTTRLLFTVQECKAVDMAAALGKGGSGDSVSVSRGLLMQSTQVVLRRAESCTIRIRGTDGAAASSSTGGIGFESDTRGGLFKADFSFENMGIGGLDNEFSQIFRRAFASRLFPPNVIERLGIRHTRGMLMYGPPGTGKTLMARQIGKMLNGKEPKVVNGPEILNKYVGQSEENIRALFADAEAEYKARGEESDLHIIIFDEIDAICKARGSTRGGTGVQDTVVNQLLSKIDGVDSLNNILVIGMTNRKDMIDEALLRPGRLEIQMEISLPDENGRVQIFRIHTKKMRENGFCGADVDLAELASLTKNYTGAEIEGVVNSATSFALNRQIDMDNLSRAPTGTDTLITRADFIRGLQEVPPAFGITGEEFVGCALNGIIHYGPNFEHINDTCVQFIKQVQNSKRTPLVSVMLEGQPGSGKTSLAAILAKRSGFPFMKLISPEKLVGLPDAVKVEKLNKLFNDCYKSPLSVVVVDDLERLLNYAPIGPHFSNAVLQTLLVLFKRPPPHGRKLLILATSSSIAVMDKLDLTNVFNAVLHVPNVRTGPEMATVLQQLGGGWDGDSIKQVAGIIPSDIPIKQLIMISEMALQGSSGNLPKNFAQCLEDYGLGVGPAIPKI